VKYGMGGFGNESFPMIERMLPGTVSHHKDNPVFRVPFGNRRIVPPGEEERNPGSTAGEAEGKRL